MKKKFVYEIAAATDCGIVKKENEDAFFVGEMTDKDGEDVLFALVADGMGGTVCGKQAANLVCDTFKKWFLTCLPERIQENADIFEEMLLLDWDNRLKECHDVLSRMEQTGGSTLTVLFLYGGTFYALNIGDSRIYRYTDNRLYQITTDHSWAQLALQQGMTASEIESDSRRHSLTRCVGGGAKYAEADYFAGFYMDSDGFLLCSDGLRRLISVTELTGCLAAGDLRKNLQNVVETAKLRQETDNLTGIAIKVRALEREK